VNVRYHKLKLVDMMPFELPMRASADQAQKAAQYNKNQFERFKVYTAALLCLPIILTITDYHCKGSEGIGRQESSYYYMDRCWGRHTGAAAFRSE
jgi:hypothetical protein